MNHQLGEGESSLDRRVVVVVAEEGFLCDDGDLDRYLDDEDEGEDDDEDDGERERERKRSLE